MNYANGADQAYLNLCSDILANGVSKDDRTGTGTLSVFGRQLRFDLSEGFPLLTTAKKPFRIIAEELLFFVGGKTNVKDLLDVNVDIWTRDAYAKYSREEHAAFPSMVAFRPRMDMEEFREDAQNNGYDLGPIYGSMWRSWSSQETGAGYGYEKSVDQLQEVIDEIKRNPDSRRLLVSAWNVAELDSMALPPCHVMFQFYVAGGKLSCQLYQRSADVFLGMPFNIASYALLTEMIAKVCGLGVGELIVTIGDAHIYTNHIAQVEEQLKRKGYALPKLSISLPSGGRIDDITMNNIILEGYESHATLKGKQSS